MDNVSIHLRVAMRREPVVLPPLLPQLYRKPHDVEIYSYDNKQWQYGGDGYRAGAVRAAVIDNPGNPDRDPMPEVYRLQPDHNTPLNCDWQWLWRKMNPELSDDKWSTLLGNTLAFSNGTGFPGRYNCITREDITQSYPAFHAPIICGGAVLTGKEDNGWLLIESLLTGGPVPTAEEVLAKPWLWFWMTSVTKDGSVNLVTRKGVDGNFRPVRIPLITRYPVRLQLTYLHKLPYGAPVPDARWMA